MPKLDNIIFKSIVRESVNAIIVTDNDGLIIFWNESAADMFGYTESEVLGKYVHDFLPAHDLREKANQSFIEFKKMGHGPLVRRLITAKALKKNGDMFDVQFNINTMMHEGKLVICAFIHDISNIVDMQAKQAKLESLVSIDELTGILNRRAFIDRSEEGFSLAKRHQEPFSFVMMDIDHFKRVNDQYGHHAGDIALKRFVNCVSGMIRYEDIFGRIGGEEFCIAMNKTPRDFAFSSAERIRKTIEAMDISAENNKFRITVSIGLSESEKGDQELISVRERADKALYMAKDYGRNQVVTN